MANLLRILISDEYRIEKLKFDDAESELLNGANPNSVFPSYGVSPMHVAAGLGFDAVHLMLGFGGNPNVLSSEGLTPLHVAASWGDKSTLGLLLSNGGDLNIQDQDGKTPFELALEHGHEGCASLVKKYKVTSDQARSREETNCEESCSKEEVPPYHTDSSGIEPDVATSPFTDTITKKLYAYLEEGKHVYFDATSPDTPSVGVKPKPSSSVSDTRSSFPYPEHQPQSLAVSASPRSDCSRFASSTSPTTHLKKYNSDKSSLSSGFSELPVGRYFPSLNTIEAQSHRDTSLDDHRKEEPLQKDGDLSPIPNIETTPEVFHGNSSPKYEDVFLPRLTSNSQARVAEYVLSSTTFMSKCTIDEFNVSSLENDAGLPLYSSLNYPSNSAKQQSSQLPREISVHDEISDSSSTTGTFLTCDEDGVDTVDYLAKGEHKRDLQNTLSGTLINSARKKSPKWSKDELPELHSRIKTNPALHALKWKAPTQPVDDDDLMTSDDSFNHRSGRGSRVYRMKMKPQGHSPLRAIHHDNQSNKTPNKKTANLPSEFQTQLEKMTLNEGKEKCPEKFPRKPASPESLFSVPSVTEFVYKDRDSDITLIERHIPSVCGSSVGRRSLDSMTSKLTTDSQMTLIYDWRTLSKVLKQKVKSPESVRELLQDYPALEPPLDSTCHENETLQNLSCTSGTGTDSSSELTKISPHLETLSCQEIAQELQKYGEMPGPVVSATRQVYLRRLSSLESNPGIVKISKTCPDYPPELRQALDGKFDSSGQEELETKLVQVFGTPQSIQWREGTEKSSFTYILLDPRITQNLPLRAKDLTDLETFKTFICAIFYIGKGKRARPYSHLYEAVTKMNKQTSKMNAKVQHIVDIWSTGLGVVSLHCFQSVIPVEAYTREACMLEAIGLHKVTNMKRGDVYGLATSWSLRQKQKFGTYLLRKALQIFLAEGERQICLPDLKQSK